MSRFLGIDTSCYTTSGAVFDSERGLLASERIVLTVKEGKRGLSQSEMVFQHVRNLPIVFKRLKPWISEIKGVGASIFPRRRADSYMPAFLVGKGMGISLSEFLDIPFYGFSHQENHAMAAIMKHPCLWGHPFYMIHMSGGTQDVLYVKWEKDKMEIQDLFHSADITAGQFIDRIGVSLGLRFPCGAQLECLARGAEGLYKAPVSRLKNSFSFAGPETAVEKIIQQKKYPREEIAFGVLDAIGRTLGRVLLSYPFEEGMPFIAVGGVASNLFLRNVITDVCHKKKMTPYFTDPEYSTDNASGNAFGACMRWSREGGSHEK